MYNNYCKEVILEKGKLPSGEYSFKGLLSLYLINKGFDKVVIKKSESIKEYLKGIENKCKTLFEKSLKFYPLNYHAWFSMGYIYRDEKDYENAFYAFLIVAIILQKNNTSWIECLISSLQIENSSYSASIFFDD